MLFEILSLFPEALAGYLATSILGRAQAQGLVSVKLTDIRNFTEDRHKTADDRPFGGGEGMVMKPEPLSRAVRAALPGRVILTSPRGRPFDQALAQELAGRMIAGEKLVLVCGRYEGVDQRFIDLLVDEEVSAGDYVLTGGELPALAVVDAVSRLLPGVLGSEGSAREESFSAGLLEYPQYTRPRVFEGLEAPEALLSGDHARIREWRRRQSLALTLERRPELLGRTELSAEDRRFLTETAEARRFGAEKPPLRVEVALVHHPVKDKNGQEIAAALTPTDLHDLARAGRTYGLGAVWIVQPLKDQRRLAERMLGFWLTGVGAGYNPNRGQALNLVRLADDLAEVRADLTRRWGEPPLIWATTAKGDRKRLEFSAARRILASGRPVLILLGTAWGLAREVLEQCDEVLSPIEGADNYNHLSVRSAAAVALDRLLGRREEMEPWKIS